MTICTDREGNPPTLHGGIATCRVRVRRQNSSRLAASKACVMHTSVMKPRPPNLTTLPPLGPRGDYLNSVSAEIPASVWPSEHDCLAR